jgi:hypothetical protein
MKKEQASVPPTDITPAMVAAAKKVLWDSGSLKYEMPGIDDALVKNMLNAALAQVKVFRQKP